MKKAIKIIGLASIFAIGIALLPSCGNSSESHENMENKEMHEHMDGEEAHEHTDGEEAHEMHAHYQCPMKCEGDKMYEEPGDCPKCGMALEKVEESHEEMDQD